MPSPVSLLRLLYGPAAAQVLSVTPRLQLWSAAFEDWLASVKAAQRSQALHAWELLLHAHPCPPWEMDREKIESWLSGLVAEGKTLNTLRCYQSHISAFYRYCARRSGPLFDPPGRPFNPVHGLLPLKERNYQNAYLLRPAEARLLLRAVDRHRSLLGKRDYAILLALLLTGLIEAELRALRWGDLQVAPGGAALSTGQALPPLVWQSLLDYLRSSGRLASIQPADYLFVPLADPLLGPPTGQGSEWLSSRPLSTEQMLVSLKAYAAWAGLDPSQVTYASLRHTAAYLRLEHGEDAAGLQAFLRRRGLPDTRAYIHHLARMMARRGRARPPWVPRTLPTGAFARRKRGAQPGNQKHLILGISTPRMLLAALRQAVSLDIDAATIDLEAVSIASLSEEILALRLLLRHVFALAESRSDHLPTAAAAAELFGRTASRIARLLLAQQGMEQHLIARTREEAIQQAIEQVVKELGIGEEKLSALGYRRSDGTDKPGEGNEDK